MTLSIYLVLFPYFCFIQKYLKGNFAMKCSDQSYQESKRSAHLQITILEKCKHVAEINVDLE